MPSHSATGRFEAFCAHEPNCWTVIDTALPLPQGPPWRLCPLTTEAAARQRARALNGVGPGGIAISDDRPGGIAISDDAGFSDDDGSGVLPNGLTPEGNDAMVADLEETPTDGR